MSIHAGRNYQSEVERIIQLGGTGKESTIRNEFQRLLNDYAKGRIIEPDGTLKDSMQLDWGYWQSKDEADDANLRGTLKEAGEYKLGNGSALE